MALNSNLTYSIHVDTANATATVRDLNGQIVKTKVPISDLNKEFGSLTATIANNSQMASGNIVIHKNSEVALQNEIRVLNTLKSSLDVSSDKYVEMGNKVALLEQKLKTLRTGGVSASGGLEQMKTASGGATSAVLELGRVVQDAPYGIRGMANNITQLVSQMAFATKSAGGFRAALKEVWAAMLGPFGIVLAISAVVSVLDGMYGGMKKTKKATDETTDSLKNQITPLQKLINLYGSLKRLLVSEKDSAAIKSYKNGLLTLDETVKVLSRNFSDFSNAYNKLTESQKKDPEAIKALVDGYKELLEKRELEQKQVERMAILRADIAKNGEKISKNGLTFIRDEKKELDFLETSYIKTQKRLIELEDYFSKDKDGGKKVRKLSPFKTGKELEIDIKSNESAIIDFNKKIEEYKLKGDRDEKLRTAKTAQEKNNINFEYEKKLEEIRIASELDSLKLKKKTEEDVVKGKYETFKIEAELRLKSYNDSIDKNLKISKAVRESLKEKAGLDTAKLIKDAGDEPGGELNKSMDEIKEKYKPLFELFELLKKARLAAVVSPPEEQVEEFDKIKHYIGVYKETMSGLTDFISGEYERQLTMEQNKTNSLNEELNNRLLNEKLSKNERESIQKQIWQNDENLRKNQEIIARKKFNTEKAFNISMAIIDTYGGASKALNDKTVPSTIARFALAAATIASGMFQVAKISSQQFQSSSAATPIRGAGIGGSGGQGDRSFNYNLVGNNQANQIAEALQGQFSNPLKAYVVSREVTTQQELDMNIKSGASF